MKFEWEAGKEIGDISKKYNLHAWSIQGQIMPKVMEKAGGVYFWDNKGKRYYDMSSQLVNLNIGHGNKKVIKAIQQQIEKLTFDGPIFATEARAKLAKMIIELSPENMGKVFFTLSGVEANENAIKIAKMITGRDKILSQYHSDQASTCGAATLSGEFGGFACESNIPSFIKFFGPYLYRSQIPFESEEVASNYYIGLLREQIIYEGRDAIAAVVLETVTGSNGIQVPLKGYLQGIRELCDEFGIIMICDEIIAGWGRTGAWFAVNHFNVKPDMITTANGITCGYAPLGCVIVSKEIAEYYETHCSNGDLTSSGHPLGYAAGVATIEYYKENGLINKAKDRGKLLAKILAKLKIEHPCVGDVRGFGLLSTIELVKDKISKEPLVEIGKDTENTMAKIIDMLGDRGFYTYSHENCIIIAPPLIITIEELKDAMKILEEVLFEVDRRISIV